MKKTFGTLLAIPFLILPAWAQGMTDGEALTTLNTINKHEVKLGQIADQKNASDRVTEYAKLMHREHDINLKQTTALEKQLKISPADTPAVVGLREKGEEETKQLKKLEGVDFDKAYINAMVQGHDEALKKLDSFIPEVRHEEVKKHLEETRKRVEHHLEEAKQIQKEIN